MKIDKNGSNIKFIVSDWLKNKFAWAGSSDPAIM